ncbi:hypothetical protein EV702DRAFT_1247706 [Suillus placidus]|uniref:Uncharacterized protein n=1 Tax=Suillus placidus TaxID=48579 RepID=A0A9P7D6T4_9AGAM|nr:hypothetical protein EV702DRAFT_1247706 [Suillus placidus]
MDSKNPCPKTRVDAPPRLLEHIESITEVDHHLLNLPNAAFFSIRSQKHHLQNTINPSSGCKLYVLIKISDTIGPVSTKQGFGKYRNKAGVYLSPSKSVFHLSHLLISYRFCKPLVIVLPFVVVSTALLWVICSSLDDMIDEWLCPRFTSWNSSDLDLCRFGHFDLNVTKLEDYIDGEPIDEDAFWFKMSLVHISLKRIGKYLQLTEVAPVPPLSAAPAIDVQSANIAWPHDRSANSSAVSTPHHNFTLVDLALKFPEGQPSLFCGKLGSGKTLSLLALLDEADILTGQVICPRSPPDALASFADQKVTLEDWIVTGVCAYVPQAAWLRNASIKDNILFDLSFNEERYQKTLEVTRTPWTMKAQLTASLDLFTHQQPQDPRGW